MTSHNMMKKFQQMVQRLAEENLRLLTTQEKTAVMLYGTPGCSQGCEEAYLGQDRFSKIQLVPHIKKVGK